MDGYDNKPSDYEKIQALEKANKELLAFAEAVDRHYLSNMGIDFSYWSEEDAQLHERAKALIAKAKGGQPCSK